jgi:hypothetical protein
VDHRSIGLAVPSPAPASPLRRFVVLSAREKRHLLEAWWRLLAAALRLSLAPGRTLERALGRAGEGAGSAGAPSSTFATQIAVAVSRAAAHHILPMTCLPRSLALQRMLGVRGIPARLRIGVRKEPTGGGAIAAHAWIEVGGVPVGEPETIEERFQPFLLPPKA